MSVRPGRIPSWRASAATLLGWALLGTLGCTRSSTRVARARGVHDLPVRWLERDLRVNVAVNGASLDVSQATELVQRAFATWSPSPKVSISSAGTRALSPAEDGENTVWFGASVDGEGAFLGHPEGQTQLYTRALPEAEEAEIIEADIVVPRRPGHPAQGDTERALLSVLVHEVGHFWGLDHPCVSLGRLRQSGDRRPSCSTLEPAPQAQAMQPDPLSNPWPDGIRPNREERSALSELYAAWHEP